LQSSQAPQAAFSYDRLDAYNDKERRMKKPWWVAALLAVLVLAGGCHNGGSAQNSTDMRALNAVVDAEPLDVLIQDDVKLSGVALGTTTALSEFSSGSVDLKVRSSTNSAVLLDKSVSLGSGSINTLALYGKRGSINTLLLTESTTTPSSGKFNVRAVGLSPDAGAVDVYFTSGNVADVPASFSGLSYGIVTSYAEATPGTYRIFITPAGTKEILFQSTPQVVADGASLTVAVFPSAGGKLVNAVLLLEGSSGSGTLLPNPMGRLKAVNAIPGASPLNFKADGATLLSSVPFAGASSYVPLATGNRALQLEAANVPGTIIATSTQSIGAASDYTLLALDSVAAPRLALVADDNTLPTAGFAKLRFINALVGSTSVDVLVDFASQASGVAYGSASGYSQLVPGTTYTITFSTPGGVTVIATLSPAELDAGAVYTAILLGNSGAAQVRLVRDR
jgi:hypothetical protein